MNIQERAYQEIKNYNDTVSRKLIALELLNKLPKEIQELDADINAFKKYNPETYEETNEYYLHIRAFQSSNEADLMYLFKINGFIGLKSKHSYGETFSAEGKAICDGTEVNISILGLKKPATCVLEVYEETIKRYRAVCTQDGEEL